jgi:ribosomal protein L37AE/L43A
MFKSIQKNKIIHKKNECSLCNNKTYIIFSNTGELISQCLGCNKSFENCEQKKETHSIKQSYESFINLNKNQKNIAFI